MSKEADAKAVVLHQPLVFCNMLCTDTCIFRNDLEIIDIVHTLNLYQIPDHRKHLVCKDIRGKSGILTLLLQQIF